MAGSIESLLGIVAMKKASGVVLPSGQVPALLMGGARSPLTMPPLSPAMMDALLEELLSVEERATLSSLGTVETSYRSEQQGSFVVRARTSGDQLTITVTKGTAKAPPERAPERPVPAPAITPAAAAEAPPPPPAPPAAVADPRLEALIEQAVARGATDLLMSSGSRPLFRVDGQLVEAGAALGSVEELRAVFAPHLAPARLAQLDGGGSVDFALDHPSGRVRVNLFRHLGGLAAALRPLRGEIPTLAELQLPPALAALVELPHGLVLVTGATGSGKSTTLAALIEHLNRTRACHIVTLEDPIEYRHGRGRALIHQREVGAHMDSFASGLRAALRENPDVLLVGEMRDPETIRLTLTAAQTGHLVLSTLHSGSAVMGIERVIDVFRDSEKLHVRQELAASLRQVVAQQLLPGARGGRVPVLEMLAINHGAAAQIRDGRTHMLATQMEIGGDGMVPLERTLAELVRAGRITAATALAATHNREALLKLLDGR
jgi:twitching motility protein PilT